MVNKHPVFSYKIPDPCSEKRGFLRESSKSKSVKELDEATCLHRNGLDEYLAVIFPGQVFVHDSTIPGIKKRYRPDYRCEQLKLIVEFDGLQHYTSPENICKDEEHTKFYESLGYNVVRIPYFIQLTNQAVKKLFGVEVREKLFNVSFPSLKNGATPAFLCCEGVYRMAKEFAEFPEQYKVNIDFLKSWDKAYSKLNGVEYLEEAYYEQNPKKVSGDPYKFYLEGIEYLNIALYEHKKILEKNVDGFGTIHSGPRNSNLALSIEFFMKSIKLKQNDSAISSHNLKKLFKTMNHKTQCDISNMFDKRKTGISLEELLEKERTAYVDRRYISEETSKEKQFYIDDMFAFANIVKEVASKLCE